MNLSPALGIWPKAQKGDICLIYDFPIKSSNPPSGEEIIIEFPDEEAEAQSQCRADTYSVSSRAGISPRTPGSTTCAACSAALHQSKRFGEL